MAPALYPEHPDFADDSERIAWQALREHLRDQDVLMHGVRFTDPDDGDVEIDLLVLLPELGAVAIEVKGGHVTYTDGEVRQTGADGTKVIDPAGQAMRGMHSLKRYLEGQPAWSRGALRAAWLVCLPYTDVSADLGPQLRRHATIGRADVPDLAGRAFDRLQDPAIQAPNPPPPRVESAIAALRGTVDQPAVIRARSAARLRHVDDLTHAQSALLDFAAPIRRYQVTGPAGTGKTWLALEQARRWSDAGERVCVVSYGRGVAEWMRRATAELPERSRPAFVGTFHQLGWTWGVTPGASASQSAWEAEVPLRMLTAATLLPTEERFTAFVVDEAQDFADSWWPALLASAAGDDVRLSVWRDDEQSVFTQRRGRPDLDLVPLTLKENLRNATQVVDTYRPLVSAEITAGGGEGLPVEFVTCAAADVMGAADDVVDELLEVRGWLPEHVALLTTAHRHPVHIEASADKATYWDDYWGTDVFYATVAGFKGLERPVVVLAVDGFHDGIDPASVMYAGMSRARDLLIVVGPVDVVEGAVGEKVTRRLLRGSRPARTLES